MNFYALTVIKSFELSSCVFESPPTLRPIPAVLIRAMEACELQMVEEPRSKTIRLGVVRVTCTGCIGSIERGPGLLAGIGQECVLSVSVDLMTEIARVKCQVNKTFLLEFMEGVKTLGFYACMSDTGRQAQLESLSKPLPAQFGTDRRFIVSACQSLFHQLPTMDILVAISTLTVFSFSLISMAHSPLLPFKDYSKRQSTYRQPSRVRVDTALSQIVKLVEAAQMEKEPMQGFADRVCGCLDCLCALGLAIPTAFMIGTRLAVQHEVIFKSGAVLENGQKINKVVFNKMGILTTGQVEVIYYQTRDVSHNPERMLLLTALAESQSKHLLGWAIVRQLKVVRHLPAEVTLNSLDSVIGFNSKKGFGIQWQCKGYISLSDIVRPEAERVIQALHTMSIAIAMVTGDNPITTRYIFRKLGITEVHAVAMVGEGINHSPPTADLGIAPGSGTDVTIEAADGILMRSDLADVNLGWACLYNLIGLPLVMGLLIPLGIHLYPMVADIAMAASSTSIVVNSLLLYWQWKKPDLQSRLSTRFSFTCLRTRCAYLPLQACDLEIFA
ncbi:hypothetical protein BY458DRAFT_489062 [Sporodiniella umbellata]|nr:hypothetical protein BY458DRAFT_489062 [Sporodiniella umbellata]